MLVLRAADHINEDKLGRPHHSTPSLPSFRLDLSRRRPTSTAGFAYLLVASSRVGSEMIKRMASNSRHCGDVCWGKVGGPGVERTKRMKVLVQGSLLQ